MRLPPRIHWTALPGRLVPYFIKKKLCIIVLPSTASPPTPSHSFKARFAYVFCIHQHTTYLKGNAHGSFSQSYAPYADLAKSTPNFTNNTSHRPSFHLYAYHRRTLAQLQETQELLLTSLTLLGPTVVSLTLIKPHKHEACDISHFPSLF